MITILSFARRRQWKDNAGRRGFSSWSQWAMYSVLLVIATIAWLTSGVNKQRHLMVQRPSHTPRVSSTSVTGPNGYFPRALSTEILHSRTSHLQWGTDNCYGPAHQMQLTYAMEVCFQLSWCLRTSSGPGNPLTSILCKHNFVSKR